MKKYILGLLAVMIAVTISAFTIVKGNNSKKAQSLYWYDTNAAGTQLLSFIDQGEKADIMVTTGCEDDLNQDFCARGYESPQTLGTAPVPSDEEILKTEVTP
ncbi:MAG: hypothetical protein HYZ15_05600 [Sphingobacteriales bacterium]|nr:hypothetical protein [Sphingobacteriales bacterium]